MPEWYGTQKSLRVVTDLAQASKSYIVDASLDWGKSHFQPDEVTFTIEERPTREVPSGRCSSLSEVLLEPPVVHMAIGGSSSGPKSPIRHPKARWSTRCNLHDLPAPIEPAPQLWQPDPEGTTPVSKLIFELPRSYVWPSGPPARFTPDPSKRCLEPDCPLGRFVTGHQQGPYCHNGIPRIRARGPIFGVSNPPPEIWDAYGRLAANRGLGGSKEDENLVLPFAYFHAGNLAGLDSPTIDFLFGDHSENQYTEAFLQGLGLVKTSEKSGERPFLPRVLSR